MTPTGPHWSTLLTAPELDAYIATKRESYAATCRSKYSASNQGKRLSNALSFLTTAKARLPHNEAANWEAIELRTASGQCELSSAAIKTTPFALAVADMTTPFEGNQAGFNAHMRGREMPAGHRRSSYNKGRRTRKDASGPAVLPLRERPRDTRPMRRDINSVIQLLKTAGRDVKVTIDVPPKAAGSLINDLPLEMPKPLYRLTPECKSFSDAHFIGITPEQIRATRRSYIQERNGAPIWVSPTGAKAWLGPYSYSIVGQANRRESDVTPEDPDPVLWVVTRRNGRGVTAHDETTHRDYIQRMYGEKMTPTSLVEYGDACILAKKGTVDYLMQAKQQPWIEPVLEDLEQRTLLGMAEGIFCAPENPQSPPTAGRLKCFCGAIQDHDATQCSECKSPLPVGPRNAIDDARLVFHQVLDDLLLMRGEKHAHREQFQFELANHLRRGLSQA